jgi:pyruvate dehydrogenase E2 component (dihydrolipoamide acetyltransferase)
MAEFRMPSLGADMDAGTITHWLVHPGDAVQRGQVVAVVETDKADVEVEVFDDGIVEELLVPEGVRVDVGTPLARIGVAGAGETPSPRRARKASPRAKPARTTGAGAATRWVAPASTPGSPARPATPRRESPRRAAPSPLQRRRAAEAAEPPSPTTTPSARPRVSPRARRLASAEGVDVRDVEGTGPRGAVMGSDVERASRPPTPSVDRALAMRQAIARAMARSKREIPHYYLAHDVDFSAAQRFLGARNEAVSVTERTLPAALLLKATAVAVRRVPELNGFWVDDALRRSDAVHLGVAISLRGGGLVAPAIHDADQCTIEELMHALRDLVNRARAGSLRSSELSDPTITVTNLGEQGVQLVHGAIYPPQVALVGFGAILERPWAADGMLGVRPVVTATLAADHRASDGARGAVLLNQIAAALQEPSTL